MNLPARIRSIEDLFYIANNRIVDSVMVMLDSGLPTGDVILLLDEFIPLLLPVTHMHHWTYFDELRKEEVINLLDHYHFQWTPTEDDLAEIDPQQILEYMADSLLEAA